jgi:predicted alpha/beta superfamily hydrolase
MRWLVLLALLIAPALRAQPAPRTGTTSFEIETEARTYSLYVTLPPGYDADHTALLPTLYYLDAWRNAELVAGVHRIASTERPPLIEPVILVGVLEVGVETTWQNQRNMDFTPSPIRLPEGVSMTVGNAQIPLSAATTGGAADFLAVLRERIVPEVERRFRSDPDRRGIQGHSFGGLFGAYTMQAAPDLFTDYLLISPSVLWNDSEVFEAGFATMSGRTGTAFVAVGSTERMMIDTIGRFAAELDSAGFSSTYTVYPERDHQSVLPVALWDGLLALYGR